MSYSGLDSKTRFSLIEWAVKNISPKFYFNDFFLFVLVRRLRSLATYTKLGRLVKIKDFHFQNAFNELLEIDKKYDAFRSFPVIMEMVQFYQKKFK